MQELGRLGNRNDVLVFKRRHQWMLDSLRDTIRNPFLAASLGAIPSSHGYPLTFDRFCSGPSLVVQSVAILSERLKSVISLVLISPGRGVSTLPANGIMPFQRIGCCITVLTRDKKMRVHQIDMKLATPMTWR